MLHALVCRCARVVTVRWFKSDTRPGKLAHGFCWQLAGFFALDVADASRRSVLDETVHPFQRYPLHSLSRLPGQVPNHLDFEEHIDRLGRTPLQPTRARSQLRRTAFCAEWTSRSTCLINPAGLSTPINEILKDF